MIYVETSYYGVSFLCRITASLFYVVLRRLFFMSYYGVSFLYQYTLYPGGVCA